MKEKRALIVIIKEFFEFLDEHPPERRMILKTICAGFFIVASFVGIAAILGVLYAIYEIFKVMNL